MSLHFVLDGYNIIHQLPSLAAQKLEDGRAQLIHLLEDQAPQGSRKNAVTIVFDGKADVWGPQESSFIKVIFTSDESADDRIKQIVAGASHKKSIVVVTDDREIQYYVRALGAKALKVSEFFEKPKSQARPSAQKGRSTKKSKGKEYLSKTVEYKINKEFAEIWLRDKHKDSEQ